MALHLSGPEIEDAIAKAVAAKQGAAVAAVSTPDATDLPTAIALANATKTQFNLLRTSLRNAGVLA